MHSLSGLTCASLSSIARTSAPMCRATACIGTRRNASHTAHRTYLTTVRPVGRPQRVALLEFASLGLLSTRAAQWVGWSARARVGGGGVGVRGGGGGFSWCYC